MSKFARYCCFVLLVLLLPKCGDHPLEHLQGEQYAKQALASRYSYTTANGSEIAIRSLPALDVFVDVNHTRPWHDDVELLKVLLAEHEGRGTIILKPAGSAGLRATAHRGFMSETDVITALREIEDLGVEIRSYVSTMGIVYGLFPPAAVSDLLRSPFIDVIEPSAPMEIEWFVEPWVDSSASTQNNDQNDYPFEYFPVPDAWQVSKGSTARVMVMERGYHRGHPDMPWLSDSNCPGWDFGSGQVLFGPGCQGEGDHGTQVLSVIAALDNTIGTVGVAPDTDPSNLFSWRIDMGPGAFVQGLYFAESLGIDIVNISGGFAGFQYDHAVAVASANSNGILMVAAAGNDSAESYRYPASYPQVMAVAGVTHDWYFDGESSWGTHIEICAPMAKLVTSDSAGSPQSRNC